MNRIGLVLIVLLRCSLGWAQSDELLQRLSHRAFATDLGAPSGIAAIAQTLDGTLWLGGAEGLSRFDGLKFVRYPGPSDAPLPSPSVSALIASPDGGLWIGFWGGGISSLKAGHLVNYGKREGVPDGVVRGFAWDHQNTLWAAVRGGLARLRGDRWERVASDTLLSTTAVLVDEAGTVWVANRNRVFARTSSQDSFREIAKVDDTFGSPHSHLVSSPDGKVWASFSGLILAIAPMTEAQPNKVQAIHIPNIGPPQLLVDDRSLWLGDEDLRRIPDDELNAEGPLSEAYLRADTFTHGDGLTAGDVQVLFQDREENIWVATSSGLDRFSRRSVQRVSLPPCPTYGYALVAGDEGRVWATCPGTDSQQGYLAQIRDDTVVSRRAGNFTTAYRDPDGTVWFGGRRELARLDGDQVVTIPLPDAAAGHYAHSIVRDTAGSMLVSVAQGVFRYSGGQWSEYAPLSHLGLGAVVEAAGAGGTLWFGSWDGRVASVRGTDQRAFDASSGLTVGPVTSIVTQDNFVWVGGKSGLARFDGARFVPVLSASGAAFDGISGMVVSRSGDLWLNAIGGIVRVGREEIDHLLRDPGYRVQCQTFDHFDGVPGAPQWVRRSSTAIEATDGRLWFAMYGDVAVIDVAHIVRRVLAPPVTIWSVSAGGREYANLGTPLRLPIHTTSVRIEYTAGSLTIPEHVQFRYKLEGSEAEWQYAGNRHEALYTNLGPGPYTFRVSASNSDGVWHDAGTAIRFTIVPAYYQTAWFRWLCALLAVACLVALYALRMEQIRAQVRGRLAARLAERERIARELHDTLLQGVQGLIWRFQAATDRIPTHEAARGLMEEALERADEMLAEGRDRVKDLRAIAAHATDLPQALATEGQHLSMSYLAKFRLNIEGEQRDLHAIVRDEAWLIAREALTNAFRHARAQKIEVDICYSEAAMQLRIRDDGRGMSSDLLQPGVTLGHFGIIGMRERADRIHARLEIWSREAAGTEVSLRVPGHIAYRAASAASHRRRWRTAIFRSSVEQN